VYRYCLRRTGDWAVAEDLTSVVFLEAWRRRDAIDVETDLMLPWLLGVATNVVRNQRRSLRRHAAAMSRLPHELTSPDFSDELHARLEAQERFRGVLTQFRRLPSKQQDVIALCDWTSLSYEQAAKALGVPVGTVRSRLARARAALAASVVESDSGAATPRPAITEEPA
jgi:RNA polymerase sigma-70 factor (ECF subfamily)